MKRLRKYDIIKHFKYETLSEEEKRKHKYLYQILITEVVHTETEENLIVYKSLYDGKVYARPTSMFDEEVDWEKYPNIQQKTRFEFVSRMYHELDKKK